MNSKHQKSRKRAALSKIEEVKKACLDEETQLQLSEKSSEEAPEQKEAELHDLIENNNEPTLSTSATTKKGKAAPKKSAKTKSATPKDKGSKPPNRSVLQLKITLQDITPPIWRRIQVLNNDTFSDLRNNINEAMGWVSDRSHQFIIQNPKKNSNIYIVNGALEGLVYDFKKERGRLVKEQTTKLSKYLTAPGDVILYEFDLAESWMHHIVVERILPPPPPKAWYPKIKAGKRACPPEDCGGVDGYNHLIEVYKNPNHSEYEELIEGWLQDMYPGYDPEKFECKNIFKRVWMWVRS